MPDHVIIQVEYKRRMDAVQAKGSEPVKQVVVSETEILHRANIALIQFIRNDKDKFGDDDLELAAIHQALHQVGAAHFANAGFQVAA